MQLFDKYFFPIDNPHVRVLNDTSQLAALTQQMLAEGLSEASIRKVLGGNVVRVLRAVLPER